MKRLFVLLPAFTLFGCAARPVSSDMVRSIAADNLGCRAEKIQIRRISENNWSAAGCGRKQHYVCSAANALTDGVCVRN